MRNGNDRALQSVKPLAHSSSGGIVAFSIRRTEEPVEGCRPVQPARPLRVNIDVRQAVPRPYRYFCKSVIPLRRWKRAEALNDRDSLPYSSKWAGEQRLNVGGDGRETPRARLRLGNAPSSERGVQFALEAAGCVPFGLAVAYQIYCGRVRDGQI